MSSHKKHNQCSDDTSDGCNCEICGSDLYGENNILLETKAAMDHHIDGMNTELVGRPLYVICIGDRGWEVTNSPINQFNAYDNSDILLSVLKDAVKEFKKDKKKLKKY